MTNQCPYWPSVTRGGKLASLQPVFVVTNGYFNVDSPAAVQLKSSLRESKRQLEKCQEKLTLAEAKVRQLGSHADDMQRYVIYGPP